MSQINKVAVLGSGVMGATIAAHIANAGVSVILMDMPSKDGNKNLISQSAIKNLLKLKPSPLYHKSFIDLIEAGNFEEMEQINDCDWVIEVIIENLEIKQNFYTEKVVPHLNKTAIISSNTSGLSINAMASVLPSEVQARFLGTHFFNSPRYMQLLEVIPAKQTKPDVIEQLSMFMRDKLGKGIVNAKDTANFIGNRIGIYSIFNCFKHMVEMDMTVEEVDLICGPVTARPKSAIFRTADLVGLDTLAHVAATAIGNVNEDQKDIFKIPDFLQDLIDKKFLGNKTKQGFFKKEMKDGKKLFYHFNHKTKEYDLPKKPKFASIQTAKPADNVRDKLKLLLSGKDKASDFAWVTLRDSLLYSFNCIGEIADDIVNIDNAMKWGFNWEIGPFEMFDAIGVQRFIARAEKDGLKIPEKLKKIESFYQTEKGIEQYWNTTSEKLEIIPSSSSTIKLHLLKQQNKIIDKRPGASLIDLGDGVFCLEFHTKMNAIGGDALSMLVSSTKRTEKDGVALVIGNQGDNFSAGANLAMLLVSAIEGEFDDIRMMIRQFQKASMAIKYSKIPVVAAPHHLSLGGACEFSLHADAINAYAETYMGLVEIGVGLIPAGGGTKEMAIRAIQLAEENETDISPFIFKNFMNIAMAKTCTSAYEMKDLGFLRKGDSVTMNWDNLIYDAKQKALSLARNYRPSLPLKNLKAPGRSVAASMKSQVWNMKAGNFISEYDAYLASRVADVITGGDVPAGTLITEEYLLELELEVFLEFCTQRKTLERIQHTLKTGKPLRN